MTPSARPPRWDLTHGATSQQCSAKPLADSLRISDAKSHVDVLHISDEMVLKLDRNGFACGGLNVSVMTRTADLFVSLGLRDIGYECLLRGVNLS